jgi:DNA polymerase-3 subunit beta
MGIDMKVSIDIKAARRAFEVASRVAVGGRSRPAHGYVKLTAGGSGVGTITVRGPDLALRVAVEGLAVERPGVLVLPHAVAWSILRLARGPRLTIEAEGPLALLREGNNWFRLTTLEPGAIPDLEERPGPGLPPLRAGVLRTLVQRTLYATDEESPRYALNGALVECVRNAAGWPEVVMVATDSRRIAVQAAPAADDDGAGAGEDPGGPWVIPVRTLEVLAASLGDGDAGVLVSFPPPQAVQVRAPGFLLESQLVSGRFPPYRRLVDRLPPVADRVRVGFPVDELAAAMKQVTAPLAKTDPTRSVRCRLAGGRLRLVAGEAGTRATARVDLPVPYDGPEVRSAFDPAFFLDALKTFARDDVVQVDFCGPGQPLILHNGDFRYFIMPIHSD